MGPSSRRTSAVFAAKGSEPWDVATHAGETVLHKAARSKGVTAGILQHALTAGKRLAKT